MWRAFLECNRNLSLTAIRGCLAMDHQRKDEPARTASDMTLFAMYNKHKVAPNATPGFVRSWTLAAVQRQGEVMLDVAVAAPPGTAVSKDIGPSLQTLIMDAYRDPLFIRSDAARNVYETIAGLDRNVPSPDIQYPEGMDESIFHAMLGNDDAFVSFHLLYHPGFRDQLGVPIAAVRRAAKRMDQDVVNEIKYDRRL